ncbi:MAG TPA: hypothetical protein VM118_01025 [Acidobacteriota bacterium]|nr:hypothetical protein [Acidobacteriota bacterium]
MMTVRTRMFILVGLLSCLLIAAESQSVADSTKTDLKRPRIQVSAQRVGASSGTVTQSIDIARDRSLLPPDSQITDQGDVSLSDAEALFAAPAGSESVPVYAIPWHSVNSGGAMQVGGGGNLYAANASVAQSATGTGTSDNYEAGTGYWYGTDTTSVDCACECHADPSCDGVTNVLDVVQAVNVAFRGGLPIEDPNPLCPYEDTDVDCGGFTNVIDVVKFVNVAFRGGEPGTNFCDPCP